MTDFTKQLKFCTSKCRQHTNCYDLLSRVAYV